MTRFMVGANQTRFDVLSDILGKVNVSRYDGVDFYIDGYTLFRRFYREKKNLPALLNGEDDVIRDMAVGVLNVVGHYRRYAATRLRMDNEIYVTFNRSPPKYQLSMCGEYMSKRMDIYDVGHPDYGFLNRAINTAWKFIVELSAYFEGIYCMDTPGIDDFAVFRKTGLVGGKRLKVILSSETRSYQLLGDGVIQIHPRRDDSFLVTGDNCYGRLLAGTKTKADSNLTAGMLPLLWSVAGLTEVSLGRTELIPGMAAMVKVANRMVEAGDLSPGISPDSFFDMLGKYLPRGRERLRAFRNTLMDRYCALSIPLAATAIALDGQMMIASQIYDVYDQNALEELNGLLADGQIDPELLELGNLNMSRGITR